MNDITESHLEPRVARLESGLETLTKNVSDIAVLLRENALSTNTKIDSLTIAVTQAQAPKKTDWSLFISIGFLILALGSAIFWPLNQTAVNNKTELDKIAYKFDIHTDLTLHPVGQALVARIEEQIQNNIILNNKAMQEHLEQDTAAHVELDKKLQTEYGLMNTKIESQIAALDTKLQMEVRLISLAIDNKLDVLTKSALKQNELDIEELRAWRSKANGLSAPSSAVPLIPVQIPTPTK